METFTLILNTSNNINYKNTTPIGISGSPSSRFFIDWNSILPLKYKKFKVNYTFTSIQSTLGFSASCYIKITAGSNTSNDLRGYSKGIIGTINPNSYLTNPNRTNNWLFFRSLKTDNTNFVMDRPSDNILDINIYIKDDIIANFFPNYIIILTFTPI